MLNTLGLATTSNNYLEALDYLSRLKAEGKYNETSVRLFTELYPKEIDILVREGYFNPQNN